MSIGDRIKEIRLDKGLTQDEFGNLVGLTKSSVSRLEKNSQTISDGTINNIVKEFCVNKEWLLNGAIEKYNEKLRKEKELIEIQLNSIGSMLINSISNLINIIKVFDKTQSENLSVALEDLFNSLTFPKINKDIYVEYYECSINLFVKISQFMVMLNAYEEPNNYNALFKEHVNSVIQSMLKLTNLCIPTYSSSDNPNNVVFTNEGFQPYVYVDKEKVYLTELEIRCLRSFNQLTDLDKGSMLGRMELLQEQKNTNDGTKQVI